VAGANAGSRTSTSTGRRSDPSHRVDRAATDRRDPSARTLLRPGVVVAAGFNGYGGSYTTAAGEAAAVFALTGAGPPLLDADVFAPGRLAQAKREG
jgi:glycine/D-amino acid oxidase-like deaminating enzyme